MSAGDPIDPSVGIAGVLPVERTAGVGVYGPPVWLPLRTGLDGGEVKVGCTFDSHGSQHGYECGGHHDRWAIDFIADTGTPVYAAGAGFATNITGQPGGSGFGNVVRVDHGFGISTVYAHLAGVAVDPAGEWVDETTVLGMVGSTGSSSTPHLHYERFALPSGATSVGQEASVDPGPLFACRAGFLVSFPQVAGFDSWQGLAWGSLTVASDGPACAEPTPEPAPAPDASASSSEDAPAGADADDEAPGPWATLIAPTLRIVGHSDVWDAPLG